MQTTNIEKRTGHSPFTFVEMALRCVLDVRMAKWLPMAHIYIKVRCNQRIIPSYSCSKLKTTPMYTLNILLVCRYEM